MRKSTLVNTSPFVTDLSMLIASSLEWKALGFAVVSEVLNTALSAVNGAIDIAKALPSVVSGAAGNLGTFRSAPIGDPPQSESRGRIEIANPAAFPDASDPAFDKVYVIENLTSRLSEIITGRLEKGIEQSTQEERLNCSKDIKNCKDGLAAEKRETRPL